MTRKYFIQYGPDSYHIIHTKAFNLLKEAKRFIAKSNPRAYKLTSQDFQGDWSVGENERVVEVG